MMKNYFALFVAMMTISGTLSAQDDDMYFASSPKKKATKTEAKAQATRQTYSSYTTPTYDDDEVVAPTYGNNFNVDSYNRRYSGSSSPAGAATQTDAESIMQSAYNEGFTSGYSRGFSDGDDYALSTRLYRFTYPGTWVYSTYDPWYFDTWHVGTCWPHTYFAWHTPGWSFGIGHTHYYGYNWHHHPYHFGPVVHHDPHHRPYGFDHHRPNYSWNHAGGRPISGPTYRGGRSDGPRPGSRGSGIAPGRDSNRGWGQREGNRPGGRDYNMGGNRNDRNVGGNRRGGNDRNMGGNRPGGNTPPDRSASSGSSRRSSSSGSNSNSSVGSSRSGSHNSGGASRSGGSYSGGGSSRGGSHSGGGASRGGGGRRGR